MRYSPIAARYRAEHIPLDTIVQDWYWWNHEGDPIFNKNYHDVPADLKKLHDEHIHTMISIWGMMDPASETYTKLDGTPSAEGRARLRRQQPARPRPVLAKP